MSLVAQKYLYLNSEISAYETLYFANLICILQLMIHAKIKRFDLLAVPKEFMRIYIKRSFFGSLTFVFYCLSIKLTSMSKAATLFWSNPVFIVIFARLLIGEKIKYIDIVMIVATLIGIIILENPFAQAEETEQIDTLGDILGSISAILGAIGFGITSVYIR